MLINELRDKSRIFVNESLSLSKYKGFMNFHQQAQTIGTIQRLQNLLLYLPAPVMNQHRLLN